MPSRKASPCTYLLPLTHLPIPTTVALTLLCFGTVPYTSTLARKSLKEAGRVLTILVPLLVPARGLLCIVSG